MTIKENFPADVGDGEADEFDSEVSFVAPANKLKAYNKLVVAAVGLAVTVGLIDSDVGQAVSALLTAFGVWLVPNLK